jgi:hypothetical protein
MLIVAQRIDQDPSDPNNVICSGQKDTYLSSDGTICILWVWRPGSGQKGTYTVQGLGEEPKGSHVSIGSTGRRTLIKIDISPVRKPTGYTFRRYTDGIMQEERGVTVVPTSQ